jgi:CRP/FNR family transcriptional regulator
MVDSVYLFTFKAMDQNALKAFPNLYTNKALSESIMAKGSLVTFRQGEVIMEYGGFPKLIPLLIKGVLKITRQNSDGKELFLYNLLPGQTCAMTLDCCFGNQPSEIRAVAEEDGEFIGLPKHDVGNWMREHPHWAEFVMKTYNFRFNELLQTIDQVAFKQLDQRLIDYLKNHQESKRTNVLNLKHEQIANDLNSSREVISRLLKQLENKGVVTLARNKITLIINV